MNLSNLERCTRDPLMLMVNGNEFDYDKGARDPRPYNAFDVLVEIALKHNIACSHIHQGFPEELVQILLSEEWLPFSRFGIGDVSRFECFNKHMINSRDRMRPYIGFVSAVMRMRLSLNML
ncbi:MAG: hypothetical protein ACKO69_06230, partial [Limnohabitans sp.]